MKTEKLIVSSNTKEINKRKILNYIRKYESVTRTQIFESTGISRPTVTRVIEALLNEKVVEETGINSVSSIGRKQAYIKFNPDAFYFIGINISKYTIQIALVNFEMKIVETDIVSIKKVTTNEEFLKIVADTIEKLITSTNIDYKKLIGIGVGVPGIVDYCNGIIINFALDNKLTHLKIKEYLEDIFKVTVYIDNNANTRALCEYWYGYGAEYKNIIYVICSEGIGSGIIADSKILRGKNNITGELGHMLVDSNHGCIEECCSLEAIENAVKNAVIKGEKSIILEKTQNDISKINFKLISECVKENDPLCLKITNGIIDILGTGLSNLIIILNPEIVILAGALFDDNKIIYNKLIDNIKSKLMFYTAQNIKFINREKDDNLYLVGAATLVYRILFE